jgi:methyl-accepting chemotaxis protein
MVFVYLWGPAARAASGNADSSPLRKTKGRPTVDLNDAIQKHAQWKFKFRNALHANETMDAAAISKDNNCEFGKWLHVEAKALYGKNATYAKCLAGHAAFHVEAGKVAAAVNAKKKDEAERLMSAGSRFAEASMRVGVSIIELKNEIRA